MGVLSLPYSFEITLDRRDERNHEAIAYLTNAFLAKAPVRVADVDYIIWGGNRIDSFYDGFTESFQLRRKDDA